MKKFNEFVNESRLKDDLSKQNFNFGECNIYAIALHRLYGYPLYGIRGRFLEEEWGGEREYDYEYCHIMVKLPNGNYLASSGEQTRQEMLSLALFAEDVDKISIVRMNEKRVQRVFPFDDEEDDIERIMNYIKNK